MSHPTSDVPYSHLYTHILRVDLNEASEIDGRREGKSTVLKGTAGVRTVIFSACGQSLVAAGDDKIIKVRQTLAL